MKMKKINQNEEFEFSGWIFQLSMNEGKVKLTPIRESSSKKAKKEFIPPTYKEVEAYFIEKGYMPVVANTAYEYYKELGWKDGNGKQINNWKAKMISVWFKPQNKTINLQVGGVKQVQFFQEEI